MQTCANNERHQNVPIGVDGLAKIVTVQSTDQFSQFFVGLDSLRERGRVGDDLACACPLDDLGFKFTERIQLLSFLFLVRFDAKVLIMGWSSWCAYSSRRLMPEFALRCRSAATLAVVVLGFGVVVKTTPYLDFEDCSLASKRALRNVRLMSVLYDGMYLNRGSRIDRVGVMVQFRMVMVTIKTAASRPSSRKVCDMGGTTGGGSR